MREGRADRGAALTVTARDGTKLAATLLPAPGLDRIVLLHSLGTDRSFWDPVVEALDGKASLLLVDLRGHGQSDAPAGPYSASLFASDLRALLDALGWDTAVVGGASLGGCVALQFASESPQRVSGLGLFDTTAWYGDGGGALWGTRGERAIAQGLAALAPAQAALWFSEGFRASHPELVERIVRTFVRSDPAAFAATCGLLGAFDARPLLQGIRVRAAILVGEADGATPPAMAAALHAGLPRATCTVVPGAAHFAPIEAPGLAAKLLLGLLHGDRTSDAPRIDRLPAIPSPAWTQAQRAVAQEIIDGPRGALISPFVPMLRSPELTQHAQRMGEYLRYRSTLGLRLSELAILVTARVWSQQTEWAIHAPIAMREGLPAEAVQAIAEGRRPAQLSDEEMVVHDLSLELHRDHDVCDATWTRAVRLLGEQGAVDLVGINGYYTFLAMLMNAAGTPAPASDVSPLPALR